ncbi:hypothetical protein GJ496_011671 [Pomphorhynchus laevis]|nr:hypothetical protein GJ496_011671 [Pomphorhynchus laevis]
MANRYGFTNLEDEISTALQSHKTLENVLSIFEASTMFNLNALADSCLQTIDEHSNKILSYVDFTHLSKDTLITVLKRDSFYLPETDIFLIVNEWHHRNNITSDREVTDCVRLPLIQTESLFAEIRESGLWDTDTLFEVLRIKNLMEKDNNFGNIQQQRKCLLCKQRGRLIIEENLATYDRKASVVEGDCGPTFLTGDNLRYDTEQCYAKHVIGNKLGIVIKLEHPSIINHIKMLLRYCDNRSYCYYIELSTDRKNWNRVVDYSNYLCRSWQYIYFPETVAQYIRICGVHNNINKQFNIVSINVRYTRKLLNTQMGIIVPKTNVAVPPCASVISGVSRIRNALIDGIFTAYDWDCGYTCHQLGSGFIIIQLGQPYIIDSCRLLLWDKDDRIYSYRIETSIDATTWTMAADKTMDECRSWQNLKFTARPTVFIKITGTRNTANEVFHCVHFECPSTVEI